MGLNCPARVCAELLERYYADRLAEFSQASGLWSGPDDQVWVLGYEAVSSDYFVPVGTTASPTVYLLSALNMCAPRTGLLRMRLSSGSVLFKKGLCSAPC